MNTFSHMNIHVPTARKLPVDATQETAATLTVPPNLNLGNNKSDVPMYDLETKKVGI